MAYGIRRETNERQYPRYIRSLSIIRFASKHLFFKHNELSTCRIFQQHKKVTEYPSKGLTKIPTTGCYRATASIIVSATWLEFHEIRQRWLPCLLLSQSRRWMYYSACIYSHRGPYRFSYSNFQWCSYIRMKIKNDDTSTTTNNQNHHETNTYRMNLK